MVSRPEQSEPKDPFERPEVRWGVGCLTALTAVVGLMILVFLVAIALEPPDWLQVLMGIGLVAGGAALAWLVATALGRGKDDPRG